ncbi:MAG: hypothetical protein DMF84_03615 [Acidobacteria bacterium]|nr:MAG: hypothetical protein DMF84_03615 [Acidobacteriota bacterium]
MRDLGRRSVALVACAATLGGAAVAQEHVTPRADVLLYGDNTEFRNPFREGETILGAAARIGADLEVSPRVTLSLGVFGNQRFGSEKAFEQVRPVISLRVHGRRSDFVFGTLPAQRVDIPPGPDRMGPHALLPPLQRETLTFDRPYEAGLQWDVAGGLLRHSVWLEWQRVNTPEHRERFDGGLNLEVRAKSALSFPAQVHVVHEGGQLFSKGAVADSPGAAAGVALSKSIGPTRTSVDVYGLLSRYVPDRSRPALSRDGVAFFGRAAAERNGWRGHVIFWRGRNFIKDEGDPNYLSIRRDGSRYRGTRDYAEAGVSRRFFLAPAASLDVSGRVHRVENHYEYSYRVVSVIGVRWRVR